MDPIVETRQGAVRGRFTDGVYSFKGVPCAAPPFGPNRLQPPQPVEPWSGLRDALAFGPKSPQSAYPPVVAMILPEFVGSGEDCLTLNIWSGDLGSANQPVMVWIPGGLFEYHGTSACPWYDGTQFACDGVVCVTINYRTGAEGFLYVEHSVANRGLLDQIAALRWVQENIAGFGGDPGNVTIFGESAGALSIGTVLAMPRAQGLFHRAIVQSGGAQHVSSGETGRRLARYIADKLGVEATLEAVAAIPPERLLAAQEALRDDLMADPNPARWGEVANTTLPWQPVVDGDTIPGPPLERIAAGASAGISLTVGSNTKEWRLFVLPDLIDQITPEMLAGTITVFGLRVDAALAVYRAEHPDASPGDLFAAVMTDWYWRIPAMHLADAHARNSADTFTYEFAWRSPAFDGRLGACHALEIPFVFGTLGHATEPLMGSDPPQHLAESMHAAWVAFAAHGDPGWPRYDLDRRVTMHFDTESACVIDPLAAKRKLWEGVR